MPNRVGVVIPAFNAGEFLSEAVRSVLDQTEPVDVIVVDDCSTDPQSLAVLDQLRSQGVPVIAHESNTGPGGAMNTGITTLENRYIVAVAADDLAEPEYAQEAADVLDDDAGVTIVTTPLQKFGDSSDLYVPEGAPNGVSDLLFYNTIPGVSMFRRSDWKRVGGYASLTWGEDYDFWVQLLHEVGGTCAVLPRSRYRYRIHGGQVTATHVHADKIEQQVEMVRRNPDPWRDHVDVIMDRLWRNQAELDYYRGRYGKINYAKNVAVNRIAELRKRVRESGVSRLMSTPRH